MWKVHNRVNKITKERVKNISQEGKRKEAQEGRMYAKEKEEEQKKRIAMYIPDSIREGRRGEV